MRIGFVYSEILAFASAHSVGTEFLASRNRVLGLARVTNTRPPSSVQCLGLAGTWAASITIMFLNSHRV
jgi:hypothetical protein